METLKPEIAVRLECLKLAHRHDRQPSQVVDVAKAYEEYVSGNTQAAPVEGKYGRPVIGVPKSGTPR